MNAPDQQQARAIDTIICLAATLATARNWLTVRVTALNDTIEKAKAEQLPEIRSAIEKASTAWSELEAAVKAHPELFVRPRKIEAHGIVIGFEKSKGGVEISNAERTLQLIKRHLPDMADVLIDRTEKPAKAAIAKLTGDQLKKIGVELKGTGDAVVIRPADGAVDKLVKALIKASTDDDAES